MSAIQDCKELRRRIKDIADECNAARNVDIGSGEAVANITLAFRHLEDASMRLGKAIQALDGGVSVYDKGEIPRTG